MTKFVVSKHRRYWWPIKVRLPNPDQNRAGQFVEHQFKALFEAIPTDEAKTIQADVQAVDGADRNDKQNDLLRRVVIGWNEDIQDEEKQPVEFSAAALEELLTDPWVLVAFWRAWGESISGDAGRKGN